MPLNSNLALYLAHWFSKTGTRMEVHKRYHHDNSVWKVISTHAFNSAFCTAPWVYNRTRNHNSFNNSLLVHNTNAAISQHNSGRFHKLSFSQLVSQPCLKAWVSSQVAFIKKYLCISWNVSTLLNRSSSGSKCPPWLSSGSRPSGRCSPRSRSAWCSERCLAEDKGFLKHKCCPLSHAEQI